MEVANWQREVQEEGPVVRTHSHVVLVCKVKMNFLVICFGVKFVRVNRYLPKVITLFDPSQF